MPPARPRPPLPSLPILWHHFFKACYKRTERERRAGTEKPSSSASSHRSVARSSARPPARPPGRRPLTSALSTPPLSLLLFAAAVVWVVTVVACGSSNNSGGSSGPQPTAMSRPRPSTNPLLTAPLQLRPEREEGEMIMLTCRVRRTVGFQTQTPEF